jgi:hypothetical protein
MEVQSQGLTEYQQQAIRVRDQLLKAADATEEEGWIPVKGTGKSNIALARKQSTSGGCVCGKAELFLNASPESVYHILATLNRVSEWMPSCHMEKGTAPYVSNAPTKNFQPFL